MAGSKNTVQIDLSNYKDKVGARVTPDDYLVVVEDAEMDTARSGNKMINLWFRILEGEFEGATITDRLVITEKSLFRVVGFMQAIGMPTPKKRVQVDLAKFMGQRLIISVDDGEPYNGRVKSEVRGYIRLAKSKQGAASDLNDPAGDHIGEGDEDLTEDGNPELSKIGTGEDLPSEDVDLDKLELG